MIALVFSVLAAILLLTAPLWRGVDYIVPFGQYMHAVPAVFFGVALALADSVKTKITIFIVGFSGVALSFFNGDPGVSIPYLVGIMACGVFISDTSLIPKSKLIQSMSSATYGVYLSHVFFLMGLRFLGLDGYMLPIASFVLSLAVVMVAKKMLPKKVNMFVFGG